jgi:uncharacterized protein YegP (UPF0339 family)
MGKFIINKRTDGEFQFNLKADNGLVILTSEGYTTKASCDNGIESVRKNAVNDDNFHRKKSSNGKFYFNLKASNAQVIGTSQMYEASSSMEIGISSVKSNAPLAIVE